MAGGVRAKGTDLNGTQGTHGVWGTGTQDTCMDGAQGLGTQGTQGLGLSRMGFLT